MELLIMIFEGLVACKLLFTEVANEQLQVNAKMIPFIYILKILIFTNIIKYYLILYNCKMNGLIYNRIDVQGKKPGKHHNLSPSREA
jgi:hypothetical protein